MTQKPKTLRIATAALFASVAFPATVTAQSAPVVTPPPASAAPAPTAQPPVVRVNPPPVVASPPPLVRTPAPAPVVTRAAPPPAAEAPARTTTRSEPRATARARPERRAEAPARRAAPAPAPVAEVPAAAPVEPVPAPATTVPPPVAEAPAPLPVDTAETPQEQPGNGMLGILIAGAVLALGLIAFLVLRRRRAEEEYYYEDEPVYAAPVEETVHEPSIAPAYVAPVIAPVAAAPVVEEAMVTEPDDADVEALAAASAPEAGRPWLEFLMRPVRAGTNADETLVEFELTVGNTGSLPAKDVRISTWMFAAGDSEMERSLIEPANAQHNEVDIDPGEGTKVETQIALPKDGLRGSVLPVVVADARYRLPDGSEGRTSASFAVGLPNGEGLEPFAIDLPSGLHDDVEARLHGEPERV